MTLAENRSLDELTLGRGVKLEELIDRNALGEILGSAFDLFQIPIRVFTDDGRMLGDAGREIELYTYLGGFKATRDAIDRVISEVKNTLPNGTERVTYTCASGAEYHISLIEYDGRTVGRTILGPYVPPTVAAPSDSLLGLDVNVDRGRVGELFAKLPRASSDFVGR